MVDWNEWVKNRKKELDIRWKKVERMKPGDRHIHEKSIPDLDLTGHIRYAKGHYVTRPYLKYSSSKWENGYIDFYDIFFNHLKHKSDVSLLEFGVYTGESIRYFRDYFTNPNVKIVGFDPHPCEFYGHDWLAEVKGIPVNKSSGDKYEGASDNVFFYNKDTSNESVIDCCKQYGPFDIIMDDASHYPDWAEKYFNLSWPYLKDEGLYLIEDIDPQLIGHLIDIVVASKQGRGVAVRMGGGFTGAGSGNSASVILLKSKYSITGLDEDLVGK